MLRKNCVFALTPTPLSSYADPAQWIAEFTHNWPDFPAHVVPRSVSRPFQIPTFPAAPPIEPIRLRSFLSVKLVETARSSQSGLTPAASVWQEYRKE